MVLASLPFGIFAAVKMENWMVLAVYVLLESLLPLSVYLPKSEKEKKQITPNRIYTDGRSIVCVTEKYTEHRDVHDVKQVLDNGEYYEIIFRFGQISSRFICQKNLLKRGTLRDFEKLFKGKIVRTK